MTKQELEAELDKPTIAVETAALALGISRASAYRAARAGEIPTLRFGRKVRVPTEKLRRMLGMEPT